MSLLLATMPQCTAISETKENTYRIVLNSLKITKGRSEAVIRRRTYNTMVKRKLTTGQMIIYKTHQHIRLN